MLNTIMAISTMILFIPFVLYVAIHQHKGTRSAVLTSMIAAILGFGILALVLKEMDEMILAAAILTIALSIVSYICNNPYYFKLEPAIKSLASAAYLIYFLIMDSSVTLKLTENFADIIHLQDPSLQIYDLLDSNMTYVHAAEIFMIIAMIIYGALMIYGAKKLSDISWLISKILYTPFIAIISIIGVILWFLWLLV